MIVVVAVERAGGVRLASKELFRDQTRRHTPSGDSKHLSNPIHVCDGYPRRPSSMSSRDSSPLSSLSKSPSPPDDTKHEQGESAVSNSSPEEPAKAEPVGDGKEDESPEDNDVDGELDASSSSKSPAEQDSSQPTTTAADAVPTTNALVQGDWQAVWSPQHNMYYFHNLRTNETTWSNPLAGSQPGGSASQTSAQYDAQAAAMAQGIDPELAYLDPTLAAGPSNPGAFTYAAKFNARTGAFTKLDGRNPDHVSEYERMKRMNSVFFDMDAWQQNLEQENAEEEESGKKRKKPTKKDLVSLPFYLQFRLSYLDIAGFVQGEKKAKETGKDGLAAYMNDHSFLTSVRMLYRTITGWADRYSLPASLRGTSGPPP